MTLTLPSSLTLSYKASIHLSTQPSASSALNNNTTLFSIILSHTLSHSFSPHSPQRHQRSLCCRPWKWRGASQTRVSQPMMTIIDIANRMKSEQMWMTLVRYPHPPPSLPHSLLHFYHIRSLSFLIKTYYCIPPLDMLNAITDITELLKFKT